MAPTTRTELQHAAWRRTLITLAVALAAVAFSSAHAQPPSGPPAGAGPGMYAGHAMGWGGGPGMGMSDRLLDLAGASADQKTKVRAIFTAMRTDLRAQFDAGRTLRRQMQQALLGPNVDAGAVEALRQQMLAQHDAVSRRVTQALLDAAAVLTPDQRAKLAQAMAQRRDTAERHRRERQAIEPSR